MAGEWAVVTGASSGIGLEFSRQLAASGWNILMISDRHGELSRHVADIKSVYNVKAVGMTQDLTEPDAVKRVMHNLKSQQICPKLLVNNAGVFDFKSIDAMSEKRLDIYMDLHVRAVTLLCKCMGNYMAERGGGYVLNMSSMACWMPMPGIATYSATKAYIRVFSRAFRIEMKPEGVSVTVACPGGIATDLFGLPKGLQNLGVRLGVLATPEKFVRKALRRTFRGRSQYINGGLNRMAIVCTALLPEWCRMKIKTHILDKISR